MIGTSLNGHATLLGGHHEEYLSPRLKSNIISKSTHGQSTLQVYQNGGMGTVLSVSIKECGSAAPPHLAALSAHVRLHALEANNWTNINVQRNHQWLQS